MKASGESTSSKGSKAAASDNSGELKTILERYSVNTSEALIDELIQWKKN